MSKKVYVEYPVNWINGHLRYGHKEGIIEMTDEEFQEFQKNPEAWLGKDYNDDYLELLVDDWEVDDYDTTIEDVEYKVTEE